MITLSDGTQINASDIKKIFVDKGEGCHAQWSTMVRLWNGDQYNCSHSSRDDAMNELDKIHSDAKLQGVHIGVRESIV